MEPTLLFLILTGIVGFYVAWNIGANDVANSMGTSVGSRALTVKRAVILAAVLNVAGAALVGTNVTDTVRKGIVNPTAFSHDPNAFMLGMFAALLAAGIWITLSTHLQLPVSTTHSIIGAIIGFGIISSGVTVINLSKLSSIVLSWIISPISGAIIAFLLFGLIKRYVLDSPSSLQASKKIFPWLTALVFIIISLSIAYKGFHLKLSLVEALEISSIVGAITVVITHRLLKRYKLKDTDHYSAVEKLFSYLQILSACSVAFAHGSNDVANAIGPVAAIFNVYETGVISTKVPVPIELLLFGGIGIAVGIATWGYKVIETIGKRITEITPSRGFAAEFGAATTVLSASILGLPVSTSHTLVGSVVGVGFARGIHALDLSIIRNIVTSWLLTLPIAAGLTMLIYLGLGFIF